MKKSIVDACLAQQTEKKDLWLQHTWHACVLLQVDTVWESIVMIGISNVLECPLFSNENIYKFTCTYLQLRT